MSSIHKDLERDYCVSFSFFFLAPHFKALDVLNQVTEYSVLCAANGSLPEKEISSLLSHATTIGVQKAILHTDPRWITCSNKAIDGISAMCCTDIYWSCLWIVYLLDYSLICTLLGSDTYHFQLVID